jgi:uncharacterized repeat protein (TIGR01451 family)
VRGRWGLVALVVVAVAVGRADGTAAGQSSVSDGLSVTIAGPARVAGVPTPEFVLTVTVANTRDDGQTARGVVLTVSYPPSEALEGVTGPVSCPVAGCNPAFSIPDLPLAASATFTFKYGPTAYGVATHTFAVSSAAPAMSQSASFDVDVAIPDTATRWQFSESPAVGTGGLNARHQLVAKNLGPTDATNVVLYDSLAPGQQLLAVSPSNGSCTSRTLAADIVIQITCQIGSVPVGSSATLTVDSKLPPNPTAFGNSGEVRSDTVAPDPAFPNAAGAKSYFPDRFWICGLCGGITCNDGYTIPFPYTVTPDDIVHFSDGSVIRYDGILARADGKFVLSDNTIVSTDPHPSGGGGGSGGGSGGGGGTSVPNLGVVISAKETTIQPNDADELTLYIQNTGGAGSLQTHLLIELPDSVTLLGPPYYERGSGCTGTSTIDCFLDYIPNGATTKLILEVRATAAGTQTVTATASADRDSDLSNNAASVTLQVGAALVPPTTAAPSSTTAKLTESASVVGTAIVGRVLTVRAVGNIKVLGYQWQIRRSGRWRNLVGATRTRLMIKNSYAGLRLRVGVRLASQAAIYSPASAVIRKH